MTQISQNNSTNNPQNCNGKTHPIGSHDILFLCNKDSIVLSMSALLLRFSHQHNPIS